MDKATAEQIESLGRAANAALNELLVIVQANCTVEEFTAMRAVVAPIMGAVVIDLLQPLYAAHPEITPPELQS